MKKIISITAGLIAGLFLTSLAHSVTFENSLGTPALTITTAGVAAAPNILFNPSTNVLIAGESVSTSFQINGYHDQALGKSAGQAYAMAADSNKMFFRAIDTLSSDPRVKSGTNSSALSSFTSM